MSGGPRPGPAEPHGSIGCQRTPARTSWRRPAVDLRRADTVDDGSPSTAIWPHLPDKRPQQLQVALISGVGALVVNFQVWLVSRSDGSPSTRVDPPSGEVASSPRRSYSVAVRSWPPPGKNASAPRTTSRRQLTAHAVRHTYGDPSSNLAEPTSAPSPPCRGIWGVAGSRPPTAIRYRMHLARQEVNSTPLLTQSRSCGTLPSTSQSGRIPAPFRRRAKGPQDPEKEKDHVEGDDVRGDVGGLGSAGSGAVGERAGPRAPDGAAEQLGTLAAQGQELIQAQSELTAAKQEPPASCGR